jgi:hypothetical protein
VVLHLLLKVRGFGGIPPDLGQDQPPAPAKIHTVRDIVNQIFLALSAAASLQGFASLSSVSLCFTQIVPFDVAVMIGFGLSGAFVLGSAVSGLDLFLLVREAMQRQSRAKRLKEKISPPLETS